ncbi:hypothetical protein IDH45_27960 [Paenibacillus sp. IB182363]|uniref:Uncharacterized protein n=1 Tax=Paenibacillus oceani TaxID=2772510 RepID=A0A927CFQ8_9BACL|nr:hypothetical protein [Paenibacillus oceani]
MPVNKAKIGTLLIIAAVLLLTGGTVHHSQLAHDSAAVNQDEFTEEAPQLEKRERAAKLERYVMLQNAFEAENAKFEAMPAQTVHQIEESMEQGRKVKEIGRELGLLEREVDPDYPRRELESRLKGAKAVIADGQKLLLHYKKRNDPQYEAFLQLNAYKSERLAQLEKEAEEQSKEIPQLLKELEELMN